MIETYSNDEIFNLKYAIAEFIVPRLKSYKNKVENDEIYSIPNWSLKSKSDFKNKNEEYSEAKAEWIKDLDKMIFTFEYLLEPLNYQDLDPDQIKKLRAEGLNTFAMYFDNLWD